MVRDLADQRRTYDRTALDLADLGDDERSDPLRVLRRWIDEARHAGELEPTAMCLSTLAADGPDARFVLCKGIDHGVVWFTNHTSAKGRQLATDGRAALTFHWAATERQAITDGADRAGYEDQTEYLLALVYADRDRSLTQQERKRDK